MKSVFTILLFSMLLLGCEEKIVEDEASSDTDNPSIENNSVSEIDPAKE